VPPSLAVLVAATKSLVVRLEALGAALRPVTEL